MPVVHLRSTATSPQWQLRVYLCRSEVRTVVTGGNRFRNRTLGRYAEATVRPRGEHCDGAPTLPQSHWRPVDPRPHAAKPSSTSIPPDHSDVVGEFQASGAEDVDAAVAAAEKPLSTWRLSRPPNAPRSSTAPARSSLRAQGAIRPRHDPRDGQSPRRDPRRRSGGHRRRLLHGRRRPPPLRQYHPLRAAEQVRHGVRMPVGVVRHDHAVELPHGHPLLEAPSRAGLRQHLHHQAGQRHPALHLQPGADAGRCRRSRRAWSTSSPAPAPTSVLRMVEHPDVRAISFTGSSRSGPHGRPGAPPATSSPCSLEMGGKNAMIVLEDANLDLALDGALWGAFGTTGQRCTATSRIIVQPRRRKGIHRRSGRPRRGAQSR